MWAAAAVARETLASLRAEAYRGLVLVTITAAGSGVVVGLEVAAARDAVTLGRSMTLAGRDAFIAVNVAPGGKVGSAACLALNANPSVVAAGAVQTGRRVRFSKAPGEFLTARYVLGPALRVLTGEPEAPLTGLGASTTTARRLGLAPQMAVRLDGVLGSLPVRVLAVENRTPDPGAWVYLPAAPSMSQADECLVEVTAEARTAAPQLITAALGGAGAAVQVSPVLDTARFQADPLTRYRDRPTRFAWLAAALVLTLVVGGLVWFRRAELALLRTLGTTWPQPVLIYAGHYVALLWLGGLAGTLWGAYVSGVRQGVLTGEMLGLALRTGALTVLAATIGGVLVTAMVGAGSITSQIKDRM